MRHDPDAPPAETRVPDQDVRRPARLVLEERAVVDDVVDDVVHVVREARVGGDDVVKGAIHPVGRIGRLDPRWVAQVVLRKERQDAPRGVEGLGFIRRRQVSHAALRRVGDGTAEEFGIDFLMGHRLHDVRTRDEHVARPLDHHGEVRHRRRIHRSASARPHDDRDLWHDAGGQDIAQEDVGVAAE